MNDLRLDGWVYDTESSHRQKAALVLTPEGALWFSSENMLEERRGPFTIQDCEISDRVGATPRFISHSGFGRFETNENDLVDSAIKHFTQQGLLKPGLVSRMAHSLESNLKAVVATLLISLGCVFLFVRYGIPLTMSWVADALPEEVATSIGEGGLEILDAAIFEPSQMSDEQKSALRDRMESVLNQDELAASTLVFRLGGDLGANAFALPDGTVVFTDELVELAQRDEELQAILLHELGHIKDRHALRSVLQQSSVGLLVLLVTGDVNAASQAAILLPTFLLEAHYSRAMEIEADRYAVTRMDEEGLSRQHFRDILTRLTESHEATSDHETMSNLLRTHPHVEERLELISN